VEIPHYRPYPDGVTIGIGLTSDYFTARTTPRLIGEALWEIVRL
jgi:hypothetical protein